jgi:hypothetical protein
MISRMRGIKWISTGANVIKVAMTTIFNIQHRDNAFDRISGTVLLILLISVLMGIH